ncbi:unnamed protein product [Owenia fusiformis]|uniref:Phosphatidylserine synthase n=1 Tax=Owenia fusiformis TaxID=6347 RepID=A0A8J1XVF8_OWEFU|nr:unnamed protein product [Owenia fusiformis]
MAHQLAVNGDITVTSTMEEEQTAHDWEAEKREARGTGGLFDDGTMSFFWRAHTLTVLAIFSLLLLYVAIFEDVSLDPEYNTKRGLLAVLCAFVLFGVVHTPDGPFRRPHPAFWRFVFVTSIAYELALVFVLFQTAYDARQLLTFIDKDLGKPLMEKSFGGNCKLYDSDVPDNPFHNIWDKMDGFVPTHFFGWWLKTLIIRDYWLCMVISIMFEVLEYTLEHQLPNFSECWWDHWIMDAIVCNGLGIYLGMKTLKVLSMRKWYWRGMWNIPGYKGKLWRVFQQFGPYSWTDFDWRPVSSLKRWLAMIFIIFMFLLAELNTFYLKFVLWIPPEHFLCLGRLVMLLCIGGVCMRECFEFLDNPKCKKFGQQSWILLCIIITELLITLKFDPVTISKPLPTGIFYFLVCGAIGLILYTIWHFWLVRFVHHAYAKLTTNQDADSQSIQNGHQSQDDSPENNYRSSNNNDFKQNGSPVRQLRTRKPVKLS